MPPNFWVRYALALFVVGVALVALYVAGAYAARRKRPRTVGGRTLAVEETVALAPGAYVAIVSVGARRLLLGVGAAGVTLLADLRHPEQKRTQRSMRNG